MYSVKVPVLKNEVRVRNPLLFERGTWCSISAAGSPMAIAAPITQMPNQISFLSILQRLALQINPAMHKSWGQLT